jgi:hypothetical protein
VLLVNRVLKVYKEKLANKVLEVYKVLLANKAIVEILV